MSTIRIIPATEKSNSTDDALVAGAIALVLAAGFGTAVGISNHRASEIEEAGKAAEAATSTLTYEQWWNDGESIILLPAAAPQP